MPLMLTMFRLRPAPSVSDGGPAALHHEVFIVLVNTNMGPVHDFHYFPVYSSREHTQFLPEFNPGLRCPQGGAHHAVLLTKLS